MSRPQHKVSVDNGKYTFVNRNGLIIDLCYGSNNLMVMEYDAPEAIAEMMRELDAARVVVKAARELADSFENMPLPLAEWLAEYKAPVRLIRALNRHDALTSDRTPPSAWANNESQQRKEHP